MKDNMPTLKECVLNNKELEDFGLTLLLLYSAGYTMNDFKAYIDEMMTDEDMKEVVEALKPIWELALKEVKRSIK